LSSEALSCSVGQAGLGPAQEWRLLAGGRAAAVFRFGLARLTLLDALVAGLFRSSVNKFLGLGAMLQLFVEHTQDGYTATVIVEPVATDVVLRAR